jgi:hypothetical protein
MSTGFFPFVLSVIVAALTVTLVTVATNFLSRSTRFRKYRVSP